MDDFVIFEKLSDASWYDKVVYKFKVAKNK